MPFCGSLGSPEMGTRAFEPAGRDGSEDESADVGQVCDTTGLHFRHLACVHELSQITLPASCE